MIVIEYLNDAGERLVPHRAESRDGCFGVASPALPHEDKKRPENLTHVREEVDLLDFLNRGFSVRMAAPGCHDERLIKADRIVVSFRPPW